MKLANHLKRQEWEWINTRIQWHVEDKENMKINNLIDSHKPNKSKIKSIKTPITFEKTQI